MCGLFEAKNADTSASIETKEQHLYSRLAKYLLIECKHIEYKYMYIYI